MRRPTIRRSSVATIAAATALVVATGGTSAYAAHLITSKQIKNGTIKGVDIHAATIDGSKLVPGTIPMPYGGSYAYSKFVNGPVTIGSNTQVVNLDVPQGGNYVIDATLWIRNLAGTAQFEDCTLAAGGDTDNKDIFLRPNDGAGGHRAVLAHQVVHNFAGPGNVTLTCNGGANGDASQIKVTAIRVDHLTNTAG